MTTPFVPVVWASVSQKEEWSQGGYGEPDRPEGSPDDGPKTINDRNSNKSFEENELERRAKLPQPLTNVAATHELNSPLIIFGEDSITKVNVGSPPDVFSWSIHRALLVKHSPFFRAALTPASFLESTTNTVNLPLDDNEAFTLFVQWLYTTDFSPRPTPPGVFSASETFSLGKAYCLGEKLSVPRFKNAVIRHLCGVREPFKTLTPECVAYVFDNSMPGSALRRMMIDYMAHGILYGTLTISTAEDTRPSGMDESENLSWTKLLSGGGDITVGVLSQVAKGKEGLAQVDRTRLTYHEMC